MAKEITIQKQEQPNEAPKENPKIDVIPGNTSIVTIQLLAQINKNLVTLTTLLKNRWLEEDKKRG